MLLEFGFLMMGLATLPKISLPGAMIVTSYETQNRFQEGADLEQDATRFHAETNWKQGEAAYTWHNFDQLDEVEMTGRELMEFGPLVSITEQPGSAIISYKLES